MRGSIVPPSTPCSAPPASATGLVGAGELPAGLSEREVEVLVLLARGLSNKEIAQSLRVSPKTVQHHVSHIYEKTKVQSRAAAATYAVTNGLA